MTQFPAPGEAAEVAARLRGIAFICLAVLLFTVLDTAAKYAGRAVPSLEVAWARYAVNLLLAIVILRPWAFPASYRTGRPLAQAIRALFLLASTVFNFAALQYLQLAETVSITFAAPLLVTAIAGPLLGEWAGPRRWAAVIAGFVGVVIILQPDPDHFRPEALLSVAAAFSYAGYALMTRLLSVSESPAAMLFFGALVATLLLTPTLPAIGTLPPDWLVAGAMVLTGVMGTVGHWFLILAYRNAPAMVLAPFHYTQIVWMVLAGYIVFGDWPGPSTLIGGAIVIAAGLYVLYRESVRRRE
jgi:drug/metabolite transporter (DMT)-like permease